MRISSVLLAMVGVIGNVTGQWPKDARRSGSCLLPRRLACEALAQEPINHLFNLKLGWCGVRDCAGPPSLLARDPAENFGRDRWVVDRRKVGDFPLREPAGPVRDIDRHIGPRPKARMIRPPIAPYSSQFPLVLLEIPATLSGIFLPSRIQAGFWSSRRRHPIALLAEIGLASQGRLISVE